MLPKLRKGDAGAAHPWPRAGCSMQGTARVAPLGTGVSQGSTGQGRYPNAGAGGAATSTQHHPTTTATKSTCVSPPGRGNGTNPSLPLFFLLYSLIEIGSERGNGSPSPGIGDKWPVKNR